MPLGMFRKSTDYRSEQLGRYLASELQRSGVRVESRSSHNAVLVYQTPVNHGFHFVMGLATFWAGFFWWWTVWPLAYFTSIKTSTVVVDEAGTVMASRPKRGNGVGKMEVVLRAEHQS